MVERKWFGRDPALWIQFVTTVLAVVVGFGLPGLTNSRAAAIIALLYAIAGVYVAWSVRPWVPGFFTGVIAAAAALLGEFGLHWTQEQVSALAAAAAMFVTLWAYGRVTPEHDPRPLP